jgi:hypothetical protein
VISACGRCFWLYGKAWAQVGKLCVAPGAYDGICSPAMDFSTYSLEDGGGQGLVGHPGCHAWG